MWYLTFMDSHSSLRVPASGPRFYCDNNVHRLGRSLRMLGYDTLLFGAGSDDELRTLVRESGRILLTRDSDFEGEERAHVLSSDHHTEQLKAVAATFKLDVATHRYTLCLDCNVTIESVEPTLHANSVPGWVIRENHQVWQCPACRKLFWAGSHLKRMDDKFDRLFGLTS